MFYSKSLNIAEKLVWKSNFGLSSAVFEQHIKMIKMKIAKLKTPGIN